jgi:hypothetical protein
LNRKTIRKTAGINYRWHDTRAAFSTGAIEAGADIIAVKELAGHSSIGTTMKYLKATNPALKRAVSELAARRPMDVFSESLTKKKPPLGTASNSLNLLVAGVGFEPTTFRL